MSAVREPLTTEQRLEVALRQLETAKMCLKWYADIDSHQAEYEGDSPIPDSSPVFWDNGKRARIALKAIKEVR